MQELSCLRNIFYYTDDLAGVTESSSNLDRVGGGGGEGRQECLSACACVCVSVPIPPHRSVNSKTFQFRPLQNILLKRQYCAL